MVSYSRGEWNAVVCAGTAAVFEPELPVDTVAAMWAALSEDPGPGAVIQVLVGSFGSSLGSLPSFAVAFRDPGVAEVRLMVRGAARARVTRVDGTIEEVGGLGVATWSERTVPGAVRVELAGGGGAPIVYPLVSGVVGAGRLEWELDDRAPSEAVQRLAPAAEPVEASSPSTDAPSAGSGTGGSAELVAEPVGASSVGKDPGASPKSEDTLASLTEQTFAGPVEDTYGEESDPGSADEPATAIVPPLPVEDATTGYDHLLWGETRMQSVEDAAVRAAASERAADDSRQAAQVADSVGPRGLEPQSSRPEAGEPDAAEPPRVLPMMITGIPGSSAPNGPTAAPGDHDGETVSAEHLLALQQRLAGGVAPGGGVPGGGADPAASPPSGVRASAPAAVLVVSAAQQVGERVVLDRSAVVGRRPRSVRATDLIPHLVTVASPNQDVSRSHVELRVEGSDVVATDLNTTNGTRLLRIGAEPVRLHPGEATLLVAGDRLDLGDEIELSFEGL
ncbi:MAG: FHA domain-containing protein [Actinobacteria bacterium]|nr:FHA domain-containing protein [Actinomycetota bacterium]